VGAAKWLATFDAFRQRHKLRNGKHLSDMRPLEHQTTTTNHSLPSRTLTAVILAGRLRELPLRESLNLHVLCLPVSHSGTLLETWLASLRGVADLASVRVVVNSKEDAALVRSVLPREHRTGGGGGGAVDARPSVEVMAEPAAWRGAGGIVRDVTDGLPDDAVILVCEGMRLPPTSFDPVVQAMIAGEPQDRPAGVVAVSAADEPAGVYAFTRRVIKTVARVGYVDMKEQLLPALSRANERIVTARLADDAGPLSDRETYLECVRQSLSNGHAHGKSPLRVSSRASVSGSAILDGFCIIEPGAVIEDGAVVHDSVVLWGATVGGGAVVSRSVVGPLAGVEPRARVIRTIASRNGNR
jgi:hypothetical protein